MSEIHITLAVEDQLSETVERKMLAESGRPFVVTQCLCRGGFGYLKSKINAFNSAAKGMPFFVLTDQDRGCPPDKIAGWMKREIHPNMIFRVAVMEIESWIMAHRDAFAGFLDVPVNGIPDNADTIADPKQFLVSLARRTRSLRLRQDLVPGDGATSIQGPDYNGRLCGFVEEHWSIHQARRHSESLNRAFARLRDFRPSFHHKKRTSDTIKLIDTGTL